MTSIWSEC